MNNLKAKGLGQKRIQILAENGIENTLELIKFFPNSHYNSEPIPLENAVEGLSGVFRAKVTSEPYVRYVKKGLNIKHFYIECALSNTKAQIIYYNQPYTAKNIVVGREYLFFGTIKISKSITILNPIIDDAQNPEYCKGIISVYKKIQGIPSAVMTEAIHNALDNVEIESVLSEDIRSKYNLMPLDKAYYALHKPLDIERISIAERTAAIEELVNIITVFSYIKDNKPLREPYSAARDCLNKIIKKLPYKLTNGQLAALDDIINDLKSNRAMNRLIQGDVGSGKTIVAFLAMYFAVCSGKQAALLAPTEILASQHYNGLTKLFPTLKIELATSTSLKNREQKVKQISVADIVVGTHSLFEPDISFERLSLIVTDEQQRFGVAQRNKLQTKGANADILLLSATPIPRTMSLVLYGDLDLSIIKEKPLGRKEIITRYVPKEKVKDMYNYLYEQAKKGVQSYIVVSKLEGEEPDDRSVIHLYNKLKKSILGEVGVGFVYGKMSGADKKHAMDNFKKGIHKILVCTTVIEVGVDVPAANIMVILDADRYGLAQLHQLRGRVGRGEEQGYCFVLSENSSLSCKERLDYFIKNTDGFLLAEYDLETRGAGEFLGVRQHGAAGIFNNLRLEKDWIVDAKNICNELDSKTKVKILRNFEPKYKDILKNVTLN